MARKIKKKPVKKESKEGKIIILVTAAILGIILIILLTLAIFPNCAGTSDDNDISSAETSLPISSSVPYEYSDEVSAQPATKFETPDFLKDVYIDESMDYYVDIDIKDYGIVTAKLNYDAAPITVKNFVYLTESGFYDGLTFHRIMNGFMMQGGDPQHNGQGGSENNIPGEFSSNGFDNSLSHTTGAISMARNGYDKDSASSQFFICQNGNHTDALDGTYACFGYVTEGMDIVEKICTESQPTDTNGTIPYEQQPVINSMTIRTEPKG